MRNNLIDEDIDDVVAAQKLADMWMTINLTEQACYQVQQQEEAAQNEAHHLEAEETREALRLEEIAEKEELRKEERKKNREIPTCPTEAHPYATTAYHFSHRHSQTGERRLRPIMVLHQQRYQRCSEDLCPCE